MAEAWEVWWEDLGGIGSGGGGQGTTNKVKHKEPGQIRVLKTLHFSDHPGPRLRLYNEAANLRTVHSAGARVPEVLETSHPTTIKRRQKSNL